MASLNKNKRKNKSFSKTFSQAWAYIQVNLRVKILALLLTTGLLIFLGLTLYASKQKNDIKPIEQTFMLVAQQIKPKDTVTNLKIKKNCMREPKAEFEAGPTYCGISLTGNISANSDEEMNAKFTAIENILLSNKAFNESSYRYGHPLGEADSSDLLCSTNPPTYFSNEGTVTQTSSFEVRCKIRSIFSYYKLVE